MKKVQFEIFFTFTFINAQKQKYILRITISLPTERLLNPSSTHLCPAPASMPYALLGALEDKLLSLVLGGYGGLAGVMLLILRPGAPADAAVATRTPVPLPVPVPVPVPSLLLLLSLSVIVSTSALRFPEASSFKFVPLERCCCCCCSRLTRRRRSFSASASCEW